MNRADDRLIALGHVTGVFGVCGWIKVFSHTEPRDRILAYRRWYLESRSGERREVAVLDGRRQGRTVIARLDGVDERDQAAELIGEHIAIGRDQLPETAPGEYYWADLEGLEVINADGESLGRVGRLARTGANDVLVVEGETERLIPFVPGEFVETVDLGAGVIRVDWLDPW